MSISSTAVSPGLILISGLELTWTSTTVITVAAGYARDSSNTNVINMGNALSVAATGTGEQPVAAGTGAQTITTTVSGVNGLDIGAIAASTFYAVYVIGDSFNVSPGSVIISANLTTPTLPAGYNMYLRIGYVLTDGSKHFLPFRQNGSGLDRWMWYDTAIVTSVTAGTSSTYAAVDATGALPNGNPLMVNWLCTFTPTGAGNGLNLRAGASSSTNGYAIATGDAAGVAHEVNMFCPTDSPITQAIEYKVVGTAVAIDVQAYLDQLGV